MSRVIIYTVIRFSELYTRDFFSLNTFKAPITIAISIYTNFYLHVEKQSWLYLTHSWKDQAIYTFRNSVSPNVNVIAPLQFDLSYSNVTVQLS